MIMKTIIKDSTYPKLDKSLCTAINTGVKKLEKRLNTYFQHGQKFESIEMDDKLIHDAYIKNGKRFFLYKCRINHISLRLLYTFEDNDLVIVSHCMKKNSRYEYFDYFESMCEQYMTNFHNDKDERMIVQ